MLDVLPHPLPEGRVSRYGEPPTIPDIDRRAPGAPRRRPRWQRLILALIFGRGRRQ